MNWREIVVRLKADGRIRTAAAVNAKTGKDPLVFLAGTQAKADAFVERSPEFAKAVEIAVTEYVIEEEQKAAAKAKGR